MIERLMRGNPPSTRFLWIAALTYVLTMFAWLPVSAAVIMKLRSANMLRVCVAVVFATVLIAAYFYIRRHRVPWRVGIALMVVVAAVIWRMTTLQNAQEMVHFVQYGALAGLLRIALARHVGPQQSFISALILTAVLGYLDETIQGGIPDRYFDWRDVQLNAECALVGLAVHELLVRRSQNR